jgi:hypothetical protein
LDPIDSNGFLTYLQTFSWASLSTWLNKTIDGLLTAMFFRWIKEFGEKPPTILQSSSNVNTEILSPFHVGIL